MYIVTGGAGFIGSNITKALCARGDAKVIVVDDLTDGRKFNNIVDCNIADYLDKDDFLHKVVERKFDNEKITAIFHEGACSATTEWDGRYMLNNNFEYSKALLHYCLAHKTQFIYASSAAVYGMNTVFKEVPANEKPLNVYGYSKLLFDNYVRKNVEANNTQVVGLRYFNVYGPREQHKGSMSSVAYHLNNQIQDGGVVRLFEGYDGYGKGEQRRDFVFVDDIVKVNLWFLDNPKTSGIFNVGTGQSQTFNDVANAVLAWHETGRLEYVPFPDHLKNVYQSYTQADISRLRQAGYEGAFHDVQQGVQKYFDTINAHLKADGGAQKTFESNEVIR